MRDEFQINYYRNSSEVYGVCDDANNNLFPQKSCVIFNLLYNKINILFKVILCLFLILIGIATVK